MSSEPLRHVTVACGIIIRDGLILAAQRSPVMSVLHEHARVAWVAPEQLDRLDWAPADAPILNHLRDFLAR